jgi:cytochrome c oxidase assembly protein subunit 15
VGTRLLSILKLRLSRKYMPRRLSCNPWLHRCALLTAAATLALVGAGGLVTSHGAGLAVPDWPNTYGYNMFFFPVSQWVGGVFYEHTHRLLASAVGLMTATLALWLQGRKARPFLRWTGLLLLLAGAATWLGAQGRWADAVVLAGTGLAGASLSRVWPGCDPSPGWLRWLGLAAFAAVVVQGVLGGLRVILFKDQIGVFHATLAQLFFVLVCALALFTSSWWQRQELRVSGSGLSCWSLGAVPSRGVCWLFLAATLLILSQLIWGATMRHQHAGLAIPDFPLAYGRLWPAMDPQSVARYNLHRVEMLAANPITAFQIWLQIGHRLNALLVLAAVGACAWLARRRLGGEHDVSKLTLGWLGLILTQVMLGAATIWSDKAADIATAHVVVGALSLALGGLVTIILFREALAAHRLAAMTLVTVDPTLIGPAAAPAPSSP